MHTMRVVTGILSFTLSIQAITALVGTSKTCSSLTRLNLDQSTIQESKVVLDQANQQNCGDDKRVQNKNGHQIEQRSPIVPNRCRTSIAKYIVASIIMAEAALSVPSSSLALPSTTMTVSVDPDPIVLSKGAVVIETTSTELLKSTVDSKSLVKTVFANRQELSSSVGRIRSAVSDELQNPAWKKVLRELIAMEDDLVGLVKVYPPEDIKVTLQDLAAGRLTLLVDGEIVNVAVDKSFGTDEDDITVTIKGVKQGQVVRRLPTISEPKYGPIRSYFSRFEQFWSWWESPYPSQYLLPNMAATNGDILLTGTAGTIWLIYLSAYMYYEYEREQEIIAAQEKKTKLEAAAAAKKKKAKAVVPPKVVPIAPPQESEPPAEGMVGETSIKITPIEEPKKLEVATITDAKSLKGKKRRFARLLFWRHGTKDE